MKFAICKDNFHDLKSIRFIFQNRKELPEIQRETYMKRDLEEEEGQQKWNISMLEFSRANDQMF